jgi:hypothetical protein
MMLRKLCLIKYFVGHLAYSSIMKVPWTYWNDAASPIFVLTGMIGKSMLWANVAKIFIHVFDLEVH